MTRDPPASPATAAAKIASNALVPHSQDALCIQRPPLAQGLRQSSAVDILELAPDRHAPRKARHREAARPEKLADVMRGGLAFVGEIRRQHHFLHRPIGGAPQQSVEADLLRTDAIQGREPPSVKKYRPKWLRERAT